MLVDSHCHIPLMDADMDAVLDAARANDVAYMLCVAIDLETWPGLVELTRCHDHLFASVGVHPNTQTDDEPDADRLAGLAAEDNVIAIGETGIDYYRSEGDLEWQRDRFRTHIHAARTARLPLIIHSRDSGGDTTRILKEEGAADVGGVMHCFVDDWETAKQAMDLNFYISFSGIVTFRNAREVQAVARQVPLDRLLVETDAPYLAPVPHRGKPNQPAFVKHTAEFLAELRGETYEQVAEETTRNFFNLFSKAKRIN